MKSKQPKSILKKEEDDYDMMVSMEEEYDEMYDYDATD
jgi:hypothetical protein